MKFLDKNVSAEVEYRNVLNEGRPLKEPTISWQALGQVSVDQAYLFAQRILRMCDKLDAISIEEREQG